MVQRTRFRDDDAAHRLVTMAGIEDTVEKGRSRIRKHEDAEATSRKRRFVWPGELHHSFVSAVFDLGLRCATSCAVKRLLPTSDDEAIELLLARYKAERRIDDDGPAAPSPSPPPPPIQDPDDSPVTQQSLKIAQRQIALAAECETMLRSFRPRLRARHRELCEALRFEELAQRRWPDRTVDGAERRAAVGDEHDLEMENHMNLHRRMLGTRAIQLATDHSHPLASDAAAAVAITDLHHARTDLLTEDHVPEQLAVLACGGDDRSAD